jgi:beta-glucosidase
MARPTIAELVATLTLEEQVSLLAGANFWETVAIERLGIPSVKVSDGPNGARGAGAFTTGVPAASFPVGISLASTWDIKLVEEIGAAIAEEARTKAAQVVLAPTVNLHRSPLGGRNFESFSEDPWLAGTLGAAYVRGLQSQGVGASLKHYAGNEAEFERFTIDSQIDERTLRELYLRPFEIVVRQAEPWTVMASYNSLNGTLASENPRLLTEILRNEWGFRGLVMSDWTATRSTAAAANAGLDLEMPGPTQHRGDLLVEAVRRGEVSRTAVAAGASRVLELIERTGAFDGSGPSEERAVDDPRHRTLIRKAGAQGTVLLTNDGVLPIDRQAVRSIAVVGPNAATAQIMGGGSSQINAHYRISPFEGIQAVAGTVVDVRTALGCSNYRLLPPVEGEVSIGYVAGTEIDARPSARDQRPVADFLWLGHVAPGIDIFNFSCRLECEFTAQRSARHDVGVVSSGPVRVYVDDALVIDRWEDWHAGGEYFGLASPEFRAQIDLNAGQTCRITVLNRTPFEDSHVGLKALRVGIAPPDSEEQLEQAVRLAAESDVAVVCVGLNGEWDTEGMDRPHMDLPGLQNDLVRRVAAANPRTVVLLQSGGAVTMPWANEVAAIMQAWYPGQECGNAIADLLFGDVNPSGKLPQTFPKALANNPTFASFPGERGVARYEEGLFAGYRWYEKTQIEPLFPFGHGLSYTQFEYGKLRLSADEISGGDRLVVEVDLTNTGDRAGADVAQLYVRDPESTLRRPLKELKGFARVELAPGATGTAKFELDMRSFAYFDDQRSAWVADAGEFELLVGASSTDIRSCGRVTLREEWVESVSDAWSSDHI